MLFFIKKRKITSTEAFDVMESGVGELHQVAMNCLEVAKVDDNIKDNRVATQEVDIIILEIESLQSSLEVYREVEEFDKCEDQIFSLFTDEYKPLVKKIKKIKKKYR